ncbi:MAG: molecular chaperone HtpG [Candidatus Melainabacteria bacterium]|nr:molecular chaperone HtpG [Candidatus Melainabacteria bacterium]
MVTGTLKIHTENILPIIKKWLYSDKDIFVRELVSNSCDAIQKCRVLRDHAEIATPDEEFRIDIQIDKTARTLTFTDNGIGMNAEEVEKYIAQVAFSGAEEFLEKYQSKEEKDQIIGHFGLGFYSSYMVAEKVTIDTLSYRAGSTPALWTCDGSSSYTLDTGARTERGTTITLFVDKENDEFLEDTRIRSILQHYCAFLPFAIYLNNTQVNKKQPLWLKNASDCTDEEYLEFYRALYPLEPDPIFWIHLNIDSPFNLKGILYFPKITRRFDWNQNSVKLFCNRVFVSDSCKDLLPDYLMILRGAIDSPDIPLNVSRSTLQMDRTVRQLAQHISKKVSDRLSAIHSTDREKFLKAWPDIEMIVKLGMLQDDKFYERSKDVLIWKNLGGEWTTAAEYFERHKDAYKGKIFYTSEDQHSPILELYKQKGIEVLVASSMVDTPLINLLEDKLEGAKFQRTDGAIDDSILDASRENTLLDAEGRTESFKIADFIRSKLEQDNVTVEAKSLHHDAVPAFLVVDEDMRRLRETMALTQQSLPPGMLTKRTFVVNTNSKLVQSIYGLKEKDPELAQEIVHHLYDLSLLAQRELDATAMPQFVARSTQVMEKMAKLIG